MVVAWAGFRRVSGHGAVDRVILGRLWRRSTVQCERKRNWYGVVMELVWRRSGAGAAHVPLTGFPGRAANALNTLQFKPRRRGRRHFPGAGRSGSRTAGTQPRSSVCETLKIRLGVHVRSGLVLRLARGVPEIKHYGEISCGKPPGGRRTRESCGQAVTRRSPRWRTLFRGRAGSEFRPPRGPLQEPEFPTSNDGTRNRSPSTRVRR